jgi:MFS family permease
MARQGHRFSAADEEARMPISDGVIGKAGAPPMKEAQRSLRYAWLSALFIALINAISLVDRYALAMMVPEIQADLKLSDFQMSLLQGFSFALFYGIFGLLVGYCVDRYSRRAIISISIAIWSVASAATGLSKNFTQLFLSRMLVGAGEGGASPASQSLLANLFPKDRLAGPMSVFQASGMAGLGLALFGVGLLLQHFDGNPLPGPAGTLAPWRQVILAISAPGLVLALLALMLPEPRACQRSEQTEHASWREFWTFLFSNSMLWRMLLGYMLTAAVISATTSWAPTYARRVLGMAPHDVGIALGLITGIGGVLSVTAIGFLIDHRMSRGQKDITFHIYSLAALVALPLSSVGFLLDRVDALMLGLTVLMCFFNSAFGPGMAMLQMVTPDRFRGRVAAMMIVAISVGGYGSGPLIVGTLTDFVYRNPHHIGYSIATVIVVGMISATLFLRSARAQFVLSVGEGAAATRH